MTPSECTDNFCLHDGTRVCNYWRGTTHCLCENVRKFDECPKGIKKE